jgi:hypothetical protein
MASATITTGGAPRRWRGNTRRTRILRAGLSSFIGDLPATERIADGRRGHLAQVKHGQPSTYTLRMRNELLRRAGINPGHRL